MKKLWRRVLLLSAMFVVLMTVHAFADNLIQYTADTYTFTGRTQEPGYKSKVKPFTVGSRTNITVHVKMYNNYSNISSYAYTINNNINLMLVNSNTGQVYYLTDKSMYALEYDVHMTVDAGTYYFSVKNNQDYWFNLYYRVLGSSGIDIVDNLTLSVGSYETLSVTQQNLYGGYMYVTKWDVSGYSPNPNAASVTNINNSKTPSQITFYGREPGVTYINIYGADGSSDQIKVTVTSGTVAPTLLYTSLSLQPGEIVYNDVLNAPNKVTWSSSNTNVAKVTSTGKITAIGYGSCKIIAQTTKNGSTSTLTCKVNVQRTNPEFIDFIIRFASFQPNAKRLKVSLINISNVDIVVVNTANQLQDLNFKKVRGLKLRNASSVTIPKGKSKKITFNILGTKVKTGTRNDYVVQVKLKIDGSYYYARAFVDEDLGQYKLKGTNNWLLAYTKESN